MPDTGRIVETTTRRRLLAATGTLAGAFGVGNVLAAGTRSDDRGGWPMAQHDPAGLSYAPTAQPPRDDVTVRWKRPFDADQGFAAKLTPTVADGRVYAAGEDLLVCDATDGTVHYRTRYPTRTAPAVTPARAYTSPTLAVVDSGSVTGLHATGGLEVLGSRVARTRWEIQSGRGDPMLGGFAPSQASPVVAAETVLSVTGSQVLAIDASSGEERWRVTIDTHRPAVREGTVYLASFPDGVIGYDLATGERAFEAPLDGTLPLGVTAGPDQLVVATDDGLAGVSYEGSVNWQFEPEDLSRDRGAIALADGVAYGGFRGEDDNRLVAVDVSDGTELWRSPAAPESTPMFQPPAVGDDILCLPLEDGGLAGVDTSDGHVRWRFEPGEDGFPFSPAALVGETVYVVGNGHLYALEEA